MEIISCLHHIGDNHSLCRRKKPKAMKLYCLLSALLLVTVCAVSAQTRQQDSLIRLYNKYPKIALQKADSLYKTGVKKRNNAAILEALILKTTFTLKKNYDQYPQQIQYLERIIQKEKDVVMRSLLHSYVGELYHQYYLRNAYEINQRTVLEDEVPADMNTWSKKQFDDKTNEHLLASVAPIKKLQTTPANIYDAILIKGAASDTLQPTLYDFLCHRLFQLAPNISDQQKEYRTLLKDLYCDINTFIAYPLPDNGDYRLKVWQQLLTFRLHQREKAPSALLWADLERLRQINSFQYGIEYDTLYLQSLERMQQEYAGQPLVLEIYAEYIKLLYDLSSTKPIQERNEIWRKVYAICEECIQKYGTNPRIGMIEHIQNKLKTEDGNFSYPLEIYPGEAFNMQLRYKYLEQLQIEIFKLPDSTLHKSTMYPITEVPLEGRLFRTLTFNLKKSISIQDTTLRIEGLPGGIYAVKTPENREYNLLISTSFFVRKTRENGSILFQILDAKSGFPIPNAHVTFYTHENKKFRQIDSQTTNKEGIVQYKTAEYTDIYYCVTNQDNPSGYLFSAYGNRGIDDATSQSYTRLITDRSVYRPGETIYFKGYTWTSTTDTIHANPRSTQQISFRDHNDREISHQNFVSNQFGSFTGSFIIPTNLMNGTYQLYTPDGKCSIQVCDYKRPEFEIILEKPQQRINFGDTVRIKGKACCYSGILFANQAIRYQVDRLNYITDDVRNATQQNETFTDADGEFEIQFTAQGTPTSPCEFYNIKATMTDSKGETQESKLGVIAYNNKPAPSLWIPWRINKTLPVPFIIDLYQFPQDTAQEVYYRLEKFVPHTIPNQKIDTTVEKIITEGKLSIVNQDSIILPLQNQPSGVYRFTAVCKGMKKEQLFHLYSPKDKQPPIATYDWLVKEKTICQDGEKARILYGSLHDSLYIQYEVVINNKTVLRDHVITNHEITTIEIPYLKEYPGIIHLRLQHLKNQNYTEHCIELKRRHILPHLKIETSTFRDHLTPGREEEWQLKITNHGKTAFAEVLAMMYDASLDKLNTHNVQFRPEHLHISEPSYCQENYPSFYRQRHDFYGSTPIPKIPKFSFNFLNLYNIIYELPYEPIRTRRYNSGHTKMYNSTTTRKTIPRIEAMTNINPDIPLQLRKNLQPTAFFYPQLQTDSAGTVNIRFTVPDALTRWRFIALATTQDMGAAQIERYIITSKPLMVRPNLPQFMRSGDQAEIRTIVSNLSDSIQRGTVTLELLIPGTEEVVVRREVPFQIAAKQNSSACFQFEVPGQHHLLVCRIIARGTDFNDGEQHYLPILANEVLVNTTQPIFLNTAGKHTFSLKEKSAGNRNYRLTLEMTANPIWYAVQALPKLQQAAHENATDIVAAYYVNAIASRIAQANPAIINAIRQWEKENQTDTASPLSKNPELKSILAEATPWTIEAQSQTERIQSLSELFDKNRLDYLQKEALKKLADLQTTEGGWSWFKGMSANSFTTMNVLVAMKRVSTNAQRPLNEQEKTMQIKAIRFLDKEIFRTPKARYGYISHEMILYLYVRSQYNNIPIGKASYAYNDLVQMAIQKWIHFSFYEKALFAMTLQRLGHKEEATKIIESLRQYATVTPEYGMYWSNNQNKIFRYSAIQTQTAILEAFEEINGHTRETEQMQQWLLRQKETQDWGSVPSTVDAIHALLLGSNTTLTSKDAVNIKIGSHTLSTANANNIPSYLKVSYPAQEISPNMLKVEIEKQSSTPSWGGIYLQKFQRLDEIGTQGIILKVDKKLYIEKTNEKGDKKLFALEGQPLKTGDKVIVRLILSLKQDMEFLHLKDLRAACLEPTEQLSGYEYRGGMSYYKEVKDSNTNFFFDFLPRGTHIIEYAFWINQSGSYQDGVANLQCIYAPAYNAYSNSTTITVH